MEVAQLGNYRAPSSCWRNRLGWVRAVWVLSFCKLPLRIRSGEENRLCGHADPGEQKPKGWLRSDTYFTQLKNWDQWKAGSIDSVKVVKIFLSSTTKRKMCLKECKLGMERSSPHTPKFLVRHSVEDPSLGVIWPWFFSLSQSNGLAILTFCSFLFSLLAPILLACVLSYFSCVQLF